MTIQENFRVYLRKDPTAHGTVEEIISSDDKNKTKLFKVVWDNKLSSKLSKYLFKSNEITELYQLNTFSLTEKNLLVLERNLIVDSNLISGWPESNNNNRIHQGKPTKTPGPGHAVIDLTGDDNEEAEPVPRRGAQYSKKRRL